MAADCNGRMLSLGDHVTVLATGERSKIVGHIPRKSFDEPERVILENGAQVAPSLTRFHMNKKELIAALMALPDDTIPVIDTGKDMFIITNVVYHPDGLVDLIAKVHA